MPWVNSVPDGNIFGDGESVRLIRRVRSKRSNVFVVNLVPSVDQVRVYKVSSCFDENRGRAILTVVRLILVRWSGYTSRPVLQIGPRFVGTDKVYRINLVTVSSISGRVRVRRSRSDIVPMQSQLRSLLLTVCESSREGEPVPLSTASFFREPLVQESLIGTVKRPVPACSLVYPLITFSRLQ